MLEVGACRTGCQYSCHLLRGVAEFERASCGAASDRAVGEGVLPAPSRGAAKERLIPPASIAPAGATYPLRLVPRLTPWATLCRHSVASLARRVFLLKTWDALPRSGAKPRR